MKTKQVELNIDELKGFVKHIVNNNRFLQKQGKMPVALNVVGESGIGKTSSLLQVGEELGLKVTKINLAQVDELAELIGYPLRQFQLCLDASKIPAAIITKAEPVTRTVKVKKMVKKMVNQEVTVMEEQEVDDFIITYVKKQVLENGKFITKDIEVKTPGKVTKEVPVTKMMDVEIEEEVEVDELIADPIKPFISEVSTEGCLWVDEQAIQEYTKQGYSFTGEKRMSYCPPEWIVNNGGGGGILLIDDFNRAEPRFQQAIMEILDRQSYISWSLPKDWHIMLSSNPEGGDYYVTDLDPAQKTRFITVSLKYDVDIWAQWAEKTEIDTRCISFLLLHPELINQNVNARAITNFFNCISSIDDFEKNLDMIQMIGEGSVGPEFAIMFTSFINNKLDKMLSPKDILFHESESYIMGALRSTLGRGQDYRADIASVITSRIINYALYYAENNTITQKEIDRLIRLSTDPDTFTSDLQYHMIKKLLNGNKKKLEKMMTNSDVLKMAMK